MARDDVSSLLVFPENVPDVIETLRMKYGKPQMVVSSMLHQVDLLPAVPRDNLSKVIDFSLKVNNLCSTIRACNQPRHFQDQIFLQRLVAKLPIEMRREWTIHRVSIGQNELVTIIDFNDWLRFQANIASDTIAESSCNINENLPSVSGNRRENRSSGRRGNPSKPFMLHNEMRGVSYERRCLLCEKGMHEPEKCDEFISLDRRGRWDRITSRQICSSCLQRKHPSYKCDQRRVCNLDGCRYKHHRLLHGRKIGTPVAKQPEQKSEQNSEQKSEPVASTSESGVVAHHQLSESTWFKVLPVTLYGPNAQIDTLAFLDDGSSVTLLENEVARQLGIEGPVDNLCLMWTNQTTRLEKNSKRVSVQISGRDGKRYKLDGVRTVNNLSLPKQQRGKRIEEYDHLKGIPVQHFDEGRPTILLGIDQSQLSIPKQVREGEIGQPTAIKTRLGWVVFGPINDTPKAMFHHQIRSCSCDSCDERTDLLVKRYFTLESAGIVAQAPESEDDKLAMSMMESTSRRLDTGRFEIGLLWRYSDIKMPQSYDMAMKRLICLESKMRREPALKEVLCKQFQEYVECGYSRKLSADEAKQISNLTWFLPTFAVHNPNKPNKVRIVFDAAAKSFGVSLNQMLLTGPDLVSPLQDVLFRFRQGRVAVCGDIKHMFHQVRIRPRDQEAQRFLWRDGDADREPDQYVMNVMTFGASCSPSCAQYVKNKNAEEFRKEFPRAVDSIVRNHYVDDMLDSVSSSDEALQLVNEVKQIHLAAGFQIRNWRSNDPTVRSVLGSEDGNKNLDTKNLDTTPETEKVLGMWWNTSSDSFCYRLSPHKIDEAILDGRRRPTKRELLRCLMSIFDPLGFVCHLLAPVKVLLQDVWRCGIGWDETLPDALQERWKEWTRYFLQLTTISVPRWYSMDEISSQNVQLHLFSDASENVYATVAYFRVKNSKEIMVRLVGAKTKVAPLHPVSIPRLELQAAVLSCRFGKTILDSHTCKVDEVIYWSDSEVVLRWLRSDQRRYRQYVAFRVGEIIETTDVNSWRWVPSKMNVADDATKWTSETRVDSNSRWFVGPSFLYADSDTWPIDKTKVIGPPDEELRPHNVHDVKTIPSFAIPDPVRVEHWRILVRAQAYVHRYVDILRSRVGKLYTSLKNNIYTCSTSKIPPLTPEEITKAENSIFKAVQWSSFAEEMVLLSKNPNAEMPKSSFIRRLSPYIDDCGVMRHRGRIDAAYGVTLEAKRPIILPHDHEVSKMIVYAYHRRYNHANNATVINEIRGRFFITRLRATLNGVRSRCQRCKNARAAPISPEMGDLPVARLSSHSLPFTYTGLDFFGPMEVVNGRRVEKRWGVLFTCMTIRAVHVELADSLSADSCIICLRNFIARRGKPHAIYSDNGTNLHGADAELRRALRDVEMNRLPEEFEDIKWYFIPPSSPHMGGAWERLVKSIKDALRSTLPTRRPTECLLRSMLIEAESVVNSRPLTHVSVDPDEPIALTPNHFLLGTSSGTRAPGVFTDSDLMLRKQWRVSQRFTDLFWQRWIKEYLPWITRREKWNNKAVPITVGSLVIIFDDTERNSWQRGVVIEVKMGANGQTRSVVVKTSRGVYHRPVVKVAVLDVSTSKPPSQGIYGGTVDDTNAHPTAKNCIVQS